MSLRDEIAAVVWHNVHDEPAKGLTYVILEEMADEVLVLLRRTAGMPIWWCAVECRPGTKAWCWITSRKRQPRKGHEACGLRWLLDLDGGDHA
jgi:hypothetical protein